MNDSEKNYKPLFTKKSHGKEDEPYVLRNRTKGSRILFACIFVVFAVYTCALIYPFIVLFINSLKGGLEYINDLNEKNILKLPVEALWTNFVEAFKSMSVMNSQGRSVYMFEMFVNSIWYALLRSLSAAMAAVLTAYALAKYEFKARGFLYGMAIFTLTIPIVGNTGSMLKLLNESGLYNTPWYVFIAGFGGFGFNFIVLYGFFQNVSWSYAEAAMIDGASHFRIFKDVMLPQAIPTLLTLIVVEFIAGWNDYTTVLLFLPDYPTLASGLYKIELSITRGGNYPIYFAGILVSMIPILLLFSCCSKTIMKNLSVGGLKG